MLSFQHTQRRGENVEMEVQVLKFCQVKTCFLNAMLTPQTHRKMLLGASAFLVVCSVKVLLFRGKKINSYLT